MATTIWPLENGPQTINKKHPDRFRMFSPVFACFRPFLHFLTRFRTFWGCLFLTFLGRPFCALFRTTRLLPFSGCHLDSPSLSASGVEKLSSMGPEILCTTGVGEGVKVPVPIFPFDAMSLAPKIDLLLSKKDAECVAQTIEETGTLPHFQQTH